MYVTINFDNYNRMNAEPTSFLNGFGGVLQGIAWFPTFPEGAQAYEQNPKIQCILKDFSRWMNYYYTNELFLSFYLSLYFIVLSMCF